MSKKRVKGNRSEAFLLGALLFASQSSFAVTLSDVVAETLQTNPEVQEDVSARYATDHTVDQARSGYFPKIDINAGIGREWSNNSTTQPGSENYKRRELGLVIKQMIYDGYSTKSEVDQAESLVEASAYQVAGTSERIALSAASTFLNALRFDELVAITQENLDSHNVIYKQIQSRAKKGVGSQANLDQVEGRVARSHANLIATQGNSIDAKTAYQRVTGNLPDGLERPDNKCCEGLPDTLNTALEISLKRHPLLRSSVSHYEASLSQVQTAEALMRPRVHLEVEASMNRDIDGVKSKNEDALVMLRLRHNVYNGGADEAQITENEHLSLAQKEAVIQTKQAVEEEVRLAWNELETIVANIPYLKAHAEASKKSHEAYLKQFKLGRRSLLDLLDTENEKFTAQSSYINGLYQERIACYRLLASMGMLVESLGIDADKSALLASK